MTNNTIPHDHHRLRPLHDQEMGQLQALAAVKAPPVKRQVRRRTHTSRPYQERLLNMAEARREIATALKIHRASSTRHQQQQQQQQSLCNSPPAHWNWPIAAGSGSYYCSPPPTRTILRLPCDNLDLRPHELTPTAAMGGLVELEHYQGGGLERLVRSLPAQPLGLNLTFQGFGFGVSVDDDGAKDDDREDLLGSLPLTQPSPPAVETTAATHAYAPSPPALSATDAGTYSVIDAPAAAAAALVSALDGGESAMTVQQASTGGEMQGVECSEAAAAAAAADTAAWWSRIFESMESAPQSESRHAEDVMMTEAPGLPAEWRRWLCGDDVGLGEQAAAGAVTGGKPSPDALGTTMMHVDDGDGGGHYSCCCCYEGGRRSDDGEDVTLPCMDGIGDDDTQGWDGEWFSS